MHRGDKMPLRHAFSSTAGCVSWHIYVLQHACGVLSPPGGASVVCWSCCQQHIPYSIVDGLCLPWLDGAMECAPSHVIPSAELQASRVSCPATQQVYNSVGLTCRLKAANPDAPLIQRLWSLRSLVRRWWKQQDSTAVPRGSLGDPALTTPTVAGSTVPSPDAAMLSAVAGLAQLRAAV